MRRWKADWVMSPLLHESSTPNWGLQSAGWIQHLLQGTQNALPLQNDNLLSSLTVPKKANYHESPLVFHCLWSVPLWVSSSILLNGREHTLDHFFKKSPPWFNVVIRHKRIDSSIKKRITQLKNYWAILSTSDIKTYINLGINSQDTFFSDDFSWFMSLFILI